MNDAPWTVATQPWKPDGIGNHRAVIRVQHAADVCVVSVPWRRRDHSPQKMCVRIFDPAGQEVTNVAPLSVTGELGRYAFEAKNPGDYALYYMPFKLSGSPYSPLTEYFAADYSAPWGGG